MILQFYSWQDKNFLTEKINPRPLQSLPVSGNTPLFLGVCTAHEEGRKFFNLLLIFPPRFEW